MSYLWHVGQSQTDEPPKFQIRPVDYANGFWTVGVDQKKHHVVNVVGTLATTRIEVNPAHTRHCAANGSRVCGT